MNFYKTQVLTDLVVFELSQLGREQIESMTFENSTEHYDYDKLTAEGSIWIVYAYDVYADYYQQNKERLDGIVLTILSS